VLSKFAGAANELDTALLVNPHDIDGMARTIAAALSMPATERRMRWEAMMAKLRAGTIHNWFAEFIETLETAHMAMGPSLLPSVVRPLRVAGGSSLGNGGMRDLSRFVPRPVAN